MTAARRYAGRRFHIVCGDLERAVRRESVVALCHWFDVSRSTVARWRWALGVPAMTEGTRARLAATAWVAARHSSWTPAEDAILGTMTDAAAAALIGCSESAAQARRYRLGIPSQRPSKAPPHVWTPEEDALLGTMSDRWIARTLGINQSTVWRRRTKVGIEPCPKHRVWTEEEDALLGTVPDGSIAEKLGSSYHAVWLRRRKLGIKRVRGPGGRMPGSDE
jgi:hypothetical protein